MAGTPPWELEAWVLARVYEWRVEQRALGQHPNAAERGAVREEARAAVVQHWTEDLATATFTESSASARTDVRMDATSASEEEPSPGPSYRNVLVGTAKSAPTSPKPTLNSPALELAPATEPPLGISDKLGELQRALTLTMGEMINARPAGLEDRLLPKKTQPHTSAGKVKRRR
ncbi:unnamed protein product [Danaus chrysippus]|uniref:(African queen) hypothetical protein n=1 Tax=Danaus chrysippus TaxID=151541 RepID=A0A8J2QBR6_9NEOP|nr:unnamed protein product [Danaus chrysippus]